MRLWTIQHYSAYERLQQTGVLHADEGYLFCSDDFRYSYDWISRKMITAGLVPPKGVRYPIWAWYQWEGKRKHRDMRECGHAKRGEAIAQLTVEIADQDVLLSDFDLYHYPLNNWYLPIDEEDGLDLNPGTRRVAFHFAI